jgi:hypothetical protein
MITLFLMCEVHMAPGNSSYKILSRDWMVSIVIVNDFFEVKFVELILGKSKENFRKKNTILQEPLYIF